MKVGNYKTRKAYKQDAMRNRGRPPMGHYQMSGTDVANARFAREMGNRNAVSGFLHAVGLMLGIGRGRAR